MRIKGVGLGKKFGSHWVFKDISTELSPHESLAITGPNGSGKSTLLQVLANSLTPSTGTVDYFSNEELLDHEDVPININYSAPYIELIEEFTLQEHLAFHAQFHKPSCSIVDIMQQMGYSESANQAVNDFSSGMKQRLRLALAFYFDAKSIFLDEPTSNLDESGTAWYLAEIKKLMRTHTILIASNQRYEYDFCQKTIQLNAL